MAAITFSFTFFIACLSIFFPIEALNGGFSVELIHRDSPNSPFYDPSLTPSQRLANALRRSIARPSRFNAISVSPNAAQSEVIVNSGEYLMKMSIGTPPVEILAIADTGSDLTWTQCEPCPQCYQQKAPLFDPNSSSTYKDIPCSSTTCRSLDGTSCESMSKRVCKYQVSYGDRSFTIGNLAVDTVTLGSTTSRPVALPKTIIGCGHDNAGTFDDDGSGIIGLGGGAVSLISQMGSSIDGKFSYCLIPLFSETKNSSKINFGSAAVVSGSGVVSTPIVPKNPDTFYYLTLEAMSVGGKRLELSNSSFSGTSEGNIIIDSGTTLTLLPSDFYSRLESAVAKLIDLEPVEDPSHVLSLCYRFQSDAKFPLITAHFTGADVKLNAYNTFVRVSEEVLCFAFAPIERLAIFGNIAQMNFLVGYDLKAKTVSFKMTDCTKM